MSYWAPEENPTCFDANIFIEAILYTSTRIQMNNLDSFLKRNCVKTTRSLSYYPCRVMMEI